VNGYFVHAINLGSAFLQLPSYERRDSLVFVPSALRYDCVTRQPDELLVNSFGTLVAVQQLEADALSEDELRRMYESDAFDTPYARVVDEIRDISQEERVDFDFSFAWYAGSSRRIAWDFVSLPVTETNRAILLEAVLIYQLCKLTETAIVAIPTQRRAGRIDPQMRRYTEDLFGLAHPDAFLTNHHEIELMTEFYEAWGIGDAITRLRDRFDQATSSYAFYWEHAERRRDTVMNLLLGSIAAISLVAAQEQIGDLLSVNQTAVGFVALIIAAVLVVSAGYVALVSDRVQARRDRADASRISEWLRDRSTRSS
jgi:hypothetical protein